MGPLRSDLPSIAPEISAYYARGGEAGRLSTGRGRLELVRTQELLRRHLPPPPARVLDVGGATGVYARWLVGLGYEVRLVDPVAEHVEAASQSSAEQSARWSVEIGDARKLTQPAQSVDVVLLMGPLYHLTDRADRLLALREARRVLRANGLLCAVGIARYASLLDGLFRGFLKDPEYVTLVDHALSDGIHHNQSGGRSYFTTAYLHEPDELEGEVREAGFAVEEIVAVESVAAWLPDFDAWWDDPRRREWLLSLVRRVERDRALLGASSHVMAVGRKARVRPAQQP